jgi:hypothetical protein
MTGPRRLRQSARPPLSGTSINAERQFMQELRLAEPVGVWAILPRNGRP